MASPPPDTSTTVAARDHARAQGARRAVSSPTVPPLTRSASSTRRGRRSRPERLLWDDVHRARRATRRASLPRGAALRLTDLEGDACANLLVYNAAQPLERLNVADTVKVQWQAYLGAGSLLLSDMGRVLLSIVADTSGTPRRAVRRVDRAAQRRRSTATAACTAPTPTPATASRSALAKHGLGRRDIVPNVNFFKGVRVDADGSARASTATARPAGAVVELRAELPVIVVVANTPHVLDPRPDYIGHAAADHRVDATGRPRATTRSGRRPPRASGRSCNTEELAARPGPVA